MKKISVFGLILVLAQVIVAQNAGTQLLESSGATGFASLLATEYRVLALALPTPPTREALDALRNLCERSFPPDTVALSIARECDARADSARMSDILTFFLSPLGRDIASAETSTNSLSEAERARLREQVHSQWVSNRRMLLLGRLDGNLGLGPRWATYGMTLLEDLAATIFPDSSATQGKNTDARSQEKLQQAYDRLQRRMRDSVLFDMRVTYRSISNDGLQAYNEFLESFSGLFYVELVRQGLENAFVQGRERFFEGAAQIPSRLRTALRP